MAYRERPSRVRGVILWQREVGPGSQSSRILPDGCLDLLWNGHHLVVAGPDTTARNTDTPGETTYVGLRFSGGLGPALIGLPANEAVDRCLDLGDVWSPADARRLSDKVASDPARELEAWVSERAAAIDLDPLGPRVLSMAAAQLPVAVMADRLGLSARQVHRRCLPVFGYGPRRLVRVLRLHRALDGARAGAPLAQVAFEAGYADQAHLNREVRDLAGTTPTVLLMELNP